nr:zinc dependent phospholipase C family protein [uncultured Mucilaginibacter sp.]
MFNCAAIIKQINLSKRLLLLLCCIVTFNTARGFSILAHEAIIDAEWTGNIKPLLLKKYPKATTDELTKAYAYTYGGSLVADMGYMPFGSPYFTNLLHYVRSGDFILTLIEEAQNLNEYAFALGALSHYMADKYGHSLATNLSVAIDYPQLKKKFGDIITFDDDHTSHSRIEFAFDVIQIAKGNYASVAFHNFIGFEIATPVLERAFRTVYGQDLQTVFPNFESYILTFRWGVRDMFPELARVARQSDKAGIRLSNQTFSRKTFSDRIPQNAFKQNTASNSGTGSMAKLLARLVHRLPKIGPLKKMGFKYPGVTCEELFLKSMDSIMVNYDLALATLADGRSLLLPNINYDTGNLSVLNEYTLADTTYAEWLVNLRNDSEAVISPAMQQNIFAFYNKVGTPNLVANYANPWYLK